MSELINFSNINKNFTQGNLTHEILKGINLQVGDGESIAIIGPSGSGKSTLLSLIGLLDETTSGDYFLRGELVSSFSKRQKRLIRNQHIGWIFQNFNLITSMTAIENVSLPMRYNQQINKSDYYVVAKQALENVGLADKLNALPSELSGGQQQRVAIARALVNKPQLILADEPTGNLDSSAGQSIVDLLLNLTKQGTTVMLVTHDDDVAKQCSRQIRLLDGRLLNDR